ncbi:mevalonate kinase [Streptomyces sp. NPDC059003]|uniref:mevalonate kinase n=1 Tax=Streptomyces sp. NPDC059003 TaxID=3346691 RepID=UPI0036C7DE62
MTRPQPGALSAVQVSGSPQRYEDGPPSGSGRAHGKAILLGEHAVVYGAPAVALPLPALSCTITATLSTEPGGGPGHYRHTPFTVPESDASAPAPGLLPPGLCLLIDTALRQAARLDVPAMDLLVESDIPLGRGLGSSAACACALAHALDQLLRLRLSAAEVFEYIQIAETVAHGRASGIDALATRATRLVLLADGHPTTPPVGAEAWIVVADSGSPGYTQQAVGMLRAAFDSHPLRREYFLHRSQSLTRLALHALEQGRLDRLGWHLGACHALLAELQLTTDRVDALVDAALAHGALGAKMTGGGLGGCVIALTDTAVAADTLAACLLHHGAARTWTGPIEPGRPT